MLQVRYVKAEDTVSHSFWPFLFAYIKAESDRTLAGLVMPSLLALVRGERPLSSGVH